MISSEMIRQIVYVLCQVLSVAIIARAIVSWFPTNPGNRLVALLYQVTEPILAPLRRVFPRKSGPDATPLVAILVLQIVALLVF